MHLNIPIPIRGIVRAQASSGTTLEAIDRRLAVLQERKTTGDNTVDDEIAYLQQVRKRKESQQHGPATGDSV